MWTGIDIGYSHIKIVQVMPSWNGYRLAGIAKLRNTVSLPEPKDSSGVRRYIRTQIQRIFNENNLAPSGCVLGVTGGNINLRILQIPPIKSPVKFRKMVGYELLQIGGKSGDTLYSDYCRLNVADKGYPEIPILVGMAKTIFIDEQMRNLSKIGIKVADICPKAIALSHTLRMSRQVKSQETVLLADFGAQNIEMVIHKGNNLIFARNITGGGRDMTEALQSKLNIPFEEAETLKINAGKILPPETQSTGENLQIQEVLRSGAGQFQSYIDSFVSFAVPQLKIEKLNIDKILLSGGSAKLKGLAGYLGGIMDKPVEVFEPFKNVRLNSISSDTRQKIAEGASEFAIALGLALCGAEQNSGKNISFLPESTKKKKEFYRTSVPLISSGILIFIAMLIWIINTYSRHSRELANMDTVKKEQETFKKVQTGFNQFKTKKEALEENYRKLNRFPQNIDMLSVTLKLISQHLPSEAWIAQVTLGNVPSDQRAVSKGVMPEAIKEILLKGYLEDDNPDNLSNLNTFIEELKNNKHLPVDVSLKKLDSPKATVVRGKKEFEIAIKITEPITK